MILYRWSIKELKDCRKRRMPASNDSPAEIAELISTLHSRFEKIQADTAFLALKQSEFRPDDYFSMSGMMDAREQLRIESSLLSGHVFMIQEMIAKKKVKLDMQSYRQLHRIVGYTRNIQS